MMDSPGAEIGKRLAWDIEAAKSFEFRVRHDVTDHSPGGDSTGTIEEHYVEVRPTRRKTETLVRSKSGDQRYVNYQDGDRFANEGFAPGRDGAQAQVVVQRSFGFEGQNGGTDRPLPFKFFFVGTKPLQEALASAKHLGREKLLGRDCELFPFEQTKMNLAPLDIVYAVDRATGVPLEVRFYRDGAARSADRSLWTWKAESLDEVQGHHLPLRSVEILYGEAGPGRSPAPTYTRRLTVTDVQFDREYPASTFWPVAKPGSTVWDKVHQKHYVVAGEKEIGPPNTLTAAPLRAEPPNGWGGSSSWIAMAVGAACLLVAAVLARRRG